MVITGKRVEQMLRSLGFTGNPFSLREADREERQRLNTYFFQHPLFLEILGDTSRLESTIVLAKRGAGKTTFRQAIELYCRTQRKPVAEVLDVSYVEFSRPLRIARRQGQAVDIYLHVDAILQCAVTRLLESLDEIRVPAFASLNVGDLALLKAYIVRYSPVLQGDDYGQTASRLLTRIAREALDDEDLTVDASALFTTQSAEVIASLPVLVQPAAHLLRRLAEHPARPIDQDSYVQQIRDFVTLLVCLGYQAMYVLVDRLDETSLLREPSAVVEFVAPLLTDLQLLDEDRVAFKLFLPQHLNEYLVEQVDFRSKRLAVKHLGWSGDDLLNLLARRLQGYSAHRYGSMQIFCEPSLGAQTEYFSSQHPSARSVDVALVQAANNLPRDLILRCRRLFEVYEARSNLALITAEDLQRAVVVDLGLDDPPPRSSGAAAASTPVASPVTAEQTPAVGVFIDTQKRVWRDGQLLDLQPSAKEFQLLVYLCEHRYEICNNNDVLQAIWPNGGDMTNLNTTIKRLRDVVEYDSRHPRFIIRFTGRGIQLVDGLASQQDPSP